MADKWEIAEVKAWNSVEIHSPSGPRFYYYFDYIKMYDPNFIMPDKDSDNVNEKYDLLRQQFSAIFLSEGWEPYAVVDEELYYIHFFRRKISQ